MGSWSTVAAALAIAGSTTLWPSAVAARSDNQTGLGSELVLQMDEPEDSGLFPFEELPAEEGATQLVLAIDALVELGAFRQDEDPVVNSLMQAVGNEVPSFGYITEDYIFELMLFSDAWPQTIAQLENQGLELSDEIYLVEDVLETAQFEAVLGGATNVLEPSAWIDALADLIMRDGEAPAGGGDNADDAALLSFLGLLGPPGSPLPLQPFEDQPAIEPEPAQPSDGTNPASGTGDIVDVDSQEPNVEEPEVTALAESDEPGASDESDREVPLLTLLGVGGAAVGVVLALILGRRASSKRSSSKPGPPLRAHPASPIGGAPTGGIPSNPALVEPRPQETASLEGLLEASRRMMESVDTIEIARTAVEEAKRLVGAEAGILVTRSDGEFLALHWEPSESFDTGRLSESALRRVLETGQASTSVADGEPLLLDRPLATVNVPVVADGLIVGAMMLARTPTHPFGRHDIELLEKLAPLVGSAIRSATLHGSATQLADVEPLTGLKNRRCLARDMADLRREATLSYIMLDVDHFKCFNDSNGHAAGDEALRRVADLLSENVRPGDLVYRYGGEEFCVLLPGADAKEAVLVAERIRSAIELVDIPGGENQPGGRVTVSIGVAQSGAGSVHDLAERADGALYAAKHGGRNRVCLAGS